MPIWAKPKPTASRYSRWCENTPLARNGNKRSGTTSKPGARSLLPLKKVGIVLPWGWTRACKCIWLRASTTHPVKCKSPLDPPFCKGGKRRARGDLCELAALVVIFLRVRRNIGAHNYTQEG